MKEKQCRANCNNTLRRNCDITCGTTPDGRQCRLTCGEGGGEKKNHHRKCTVKCGAGNADPNSKNKCMLHCKYKT